jgi:Mn2+/Fe2+ NRAMP family transporter
MRATLYYTVLRLGLFAVALLLLYAAGARSLLLLGGAILISGVISYFVLTRQRTAMAGAIGRRVSNFRERLDAGTKAEDQD